MPGVKNISVQTTVNSESVDVHYVIMKNVWSRLEFAAAKTLQDTLYTGTRDTSVLLN